MIPLQEPQLKQNSVQHHRHLVDMIPLQEPQLKKNYNIVQFL
jgi:hypothetical protein